jgi:ATP/maltotriose-dependent transcriptional regulator MalT
LAACIRYITDPVDSAAGQCKQLVRELGHRQLTLVVDDFHHASHESYLPLLNAALRQKPPAKLILVSRLYPDELLGNSAARVFHLGAFDEEETSSLLKQRGLTNVSAEIIEELWRKTGGLPLAMTLFCTLVVDFSYAANDLLVGDLTGIDRLKQWFEEINSLVTADAARLLKLLSLTDGSFDRRTVKLLSRQILNIDDGGAFLSLNRSFLIETFGDNRWRVHDLVASMCRESVDVKVAGAVHRLLGHHYNQMSGGWKNKPKDDNDLQNKIKAFKHFSASGHMSLEASRVIKMVTPELKRRGYYHQLIDLLRRVRGIGIDKWIDYHFAHCLLITAKVSEAIEIGEQLIHSDLSSDTNLRLASYRLYAEALHASGDTVLAEKVLSDAIESTNLSNVYAATRRHAVTMLAALELQNGKVAIAKQRLSACLQEAERDEDERGVAIAKMRLGIASFSEKRFEEASKLFLSACQTFESVRDMRGHAWALTRLAESMIAFKEGRGALPLLKRASEIYDELDISEPDYLETLRRLSQTTARGRRLRELVSSELAKWG